MSILIINSAEPEERTYVDPIAYAIGKMERDSEAGEHLPEVGEWRDFSGVTEIGYYSAVIISASPRGNNANFRERVKSFEWLRTAQMPVLGICAGHQFIGNIFGSRLIRDAEAEAGITPIRIQSWDPLFTGFSDEIQVLQQHDDAISLPDDFILLARSDKCRVQAMRHAERPIYSVQWHSEISTPGLIRNFVEMCS
jgi:GMP synthase (glutamine-hydrolysing)